MGQGKDRAMLTDGAKDADAYAGGDGSLVDDIDEIGKETETMLTDGAKNQVGNVGAESRLVKDMDEIVDKSTAGKEGAKEGPVNNMDEIGLIFNFEGIKKTACLKEFGSYIKFNNKCLHRGYKRGSVNEEICPCGGSNSPAI